MDNEVKSMVDRVVAGDLNQATAHFNAALDAKREAEMQNVKAHFAQTAFDTPVEEPAEEPQEVEAEAEETVEVEEPAEEDE